MVLTDSTDEAAVLVIDDEESMREGCRQTLEQEGYTTKVAEDGESGLRLVEQLKPDVVLVDLKMPGMDGMEVIERIRRIDQYIVTIVITGYGSIKSAVAAMKVGACDYLNKPFAPERLLKVVTDGLEKHGLEKRSALLEREKEEALDNFAAVVCHQLRSPAAAAAQYLDVINTGQTGPLTSKQKSMLGRASHRVEELTQLIADWLKLTRIESGALQFKPKPVELLRIIEGAWKALPDEKARGRISLNLEVSDDIGPVRGDEHLLGELFTDLFENSVKFTSGPGDITVRLTAAGDTTVVSVRDTGVGIPPEELPHLFEPFYKGARAGVKRTGGTHLGLAIAKRIVSVHGGTIGASSSPGQGATFTLRFPTEVDISTVPPVPISMPIEPTPAVETATKLLDSQQLSSFVESIMADHVVMGVKTNKGAQNRFVFDPLRSASELRLDYDVTILPPKKYLLPPRETLAQFKLGKSPSVEPCVTELSPIVLIGVHPYDMIAINQLDRLMSGANPDPNYLARRQAVTIIGVDPARAGERAFWGAMGCHEVEEGFDLWLSDIGGAYVVEVGSQKGASLLAKYAEARNATSKDLQARLELREGLKELGTTGEVEFSPTELPGILRRSFDCGIWAEQASKCLSCGSCNLVCPTCYCFDVKDEVDISLKTAQRYRIWDGCVLEDFAKVAGDENFREQRLQRYRHRFYRKGMYLYDKYGYIACVGCGRCATACLPDIADPAAMYNTLKESNRI